MSAQQPEIDIAALTLEETKSNPTADQTIAENQPANASDTH